MNTCEVCGSQAFRTENVSEVFLIEGRRVLVDGIPARVCVRCAEVTFDRATTEIVRRMVHGEAKPMEVVSLEVFSYAYA
ncbi:MAG: YgiT-type zinc finger protein [Caldilineaceae bacterium]|nr:YgiT-type zinc finger protein [Caldilineaceae bacterium]MBP8106321.1 YgiT-type zinc finger protein [Caldilineaceae bacterium]MBP9071123.1 YgiT-type zinc finger protein [Caldilineaceae bacterium]